MWPAAWSKEIGTRTPQILLSLQATVHCSAIAASVVWLVAWNSVHKRHLFSAPPDQSFMRMRFQLVQEESIALANGNIASHQTVLFGNILTLIIIKKENAAKTTEHLRLSSRSNSLLENWPLLFKRCAIHRLNLYPQNSAIFMHWIVIYPVDHDSAIQLLNNSVLSI